MSASNPFDVLNTKPLFARKKILFKASATKRKNTSSVKTRKSKKPKLTKGENGAPAFTTTGIARLDLFGQGLIRNAPTDRIRELVQRGWLESPEHTMQIILHTRDIRKGKGEKKSTMEAILWIREHKPNTYKANLDTFLKMGCFKDLLVITELAEEKKLPALAEKEFIELELLAHHLGQDMLKLQANSEEMKGGEETKKKQNISLAAKWAPSEGKHFSHLAVRLAKLLFPASKCAEKDYRLFLKRLRAHLKVTETYMCEGRAKEIDFASVPARCHKNLRNAFAKHAPEEYKAYKEALVKGEKKINSTGLFPHELVAAMEKEVDSQDEEEQKIIIEAQWKDMITSFSKNSGTTLQNAVALVDVSGSMGGEPMQVAVALGLVISELTQGPYHNRLITFHSNPQWHRVIGNSLEEKIACVKSAPWGMSTNIQAAFRLILDTAIEHKIPPEQMPAVLFILSDMQFDQATGIDLKTNQVWNDTIKDMYTAAGYKRPDIVYWNLKYAENLPVRYDDKGVCLLSGFSPNSMRVLLKHGVIDPLTTMLETISDYPVVIDEAERGGN